MYGARQSANQEWSGGLSAQAKSEHSPGQLHGERLVRNNGQSKQWAEVRIELVLLKLTGNMFCQYYSYSRL